MGFWASARGFEFDRVPYRLGSKRADGFSGGNDDGGLAEVQQRARRRASPAAPSTTAPFRTTRIVRTNSGQREVNEKSDSAY